VTGAGALVRAHPRQLLAGALACGLALAPAGAVTAFVCCALVVILLTAARSPAYLALAAGALLLAGSAAGALRLAAIDADPLASIGERQVELRGPLVRSPRASATGSSMRIRAGPPGGAAQLVELRSRGGAPAGARIGMELIARGRLRAVDPTRDRTPRAAAYSRFLLRSGVRRRLDANLLELTGRRRGGPAGVIDRIRIRAEDALAFGLAAEPAALLRGMVLGGDAGLAEPTTDDFRAAGLSHILAVSGQNVLLIVILLRAILTALDLGRRWRLLLPAAAIVLYAALCGAQASVVRASAMGLAALAALAASRPASRVHALLLGAIVVLAFDPRATADAGAQLSFAAVVGIMAFTGPLADRLGRLPRWTAEALAVTTGATLATAPLMAFHFGAVSIVSLAANVLGEPLIGPIVWLGSLTAAAGQVSLPLAALLNAPNAFLLGTLVSLAHAAAAVPGAQVTVGGFGPAALVAGYAGLVLAALSVNGRLPAPPPPLTARLRMLACCATIALVWWLARGPDDGLDGPAIAMLDVGQGDATVLVGRAGCTALIDGGPPGDGLVGKLRAIGVRRLDAVVATHPETDHFGGLLDLARAGSLPVGTLIDGGGETPRADFRELRARLRERGTASVPAVAGHRWTCGDVSIELAGPPPQPPGTPPPANPNDRAAVTTVDVGGLRMLASGDAESAVLLRLALAPADVLKVPHHGSADPGLPRLLSLVRPSVALIGVGADNRYGHPTPQAIGDLTAAGARVLRTDRDGAIVVRPGAGGGPVVTAAGGGR
jgi:competence protein ComEC